MSKTNLDIEKKVAEARARAEEYRNPAPAQERQKRPKTMKEWRSLVEERIQAAIEEGRFDNLPGQGKPLDRQRLIETDPAMDLANGLMKNNGFAPEWVDRDLLIRRDLEKVREQLRSAWRFYQPDPETNPGWQQAVKRLAADLDKLNRQIDDYNLIVPILSKQRIRLRLEDELRLVREELSEI